MKNKASFLKSIFLVALCVTSCVLLTKPKDVTYGYKLIEERKADGPTLSCSDIVLGFEHLTRSLQNVIPPFKVNDDFSFEFVEKFESLFTKISLRYLFIEQYFQSREGRLFLDLRKLLI